MLPAVLFICYVLCNSAALFAWSSLSICLTKQLLGTTTFHLNVRIIIRKVRFPHDNQQIVWDHRLVMCLPHLFCVVVHTNYWDGDISGNGFLTVSGKILPGASSKLLQSLLFSLCLLFLECKPLKLNLQALRLLT